MNQSDVTQRSSAIFENVEHMTMDTIFNSVVLRLLNVSVLCGILVMFGSIINASKTEWLPILGIQAVVITSMGLMFALRKRLSPRIIAPTLLTALFILGCFGLAYFGLMGGIGPIVFVSFAILVGTLYGLKAGLFAGLVSLLIFALSAVSVSLGGLPLHTLPADQYLQSMPFWGYVGTDMIVVIITALYCISEIQARLFLAIAISRAEHTFAKAALDVQRDLFIVLDPTTFKPVLWNLTLKRISGLQTEEIKARTLFTQWDTFVDPVAAQNCLDQLKTGTKSSIELAFQTASNETIPFEFKLDRTYPTQDGEGLIILFGRDLRMQKAAEAALRDSEHRNRLIIENVPAVPWIANRFGHHTYLSPNIKTITGYFASEIIENGFDDWFERVHSEDQPMVKEAVMALFSTETPYDISYRFKHKTGHYIWLQDRAHTRIENGTPYACGVLLDITEQVNVTTRLRHSEKMEAIGQLAGGIAHDFNNQLAAIVGCGELLCTLSDGDPLVTQYANHIRNCARHSSVLTRKLLTFSRRDPVEKVPTDVHGVLKEAIALIERSFDKQIAIETQLAPTSPIILGDPSELQSTLLNLFINGRDAMPNGGSLTIRTDTVKRDNAPSRIDPTRHMTGRYVRITVLDTGCGMNQETVRRVFEPFYTTKPKGAGTGMGLATVFGYVSSLQGDIEIQSKLKQGTTVSIELPLMQEAVRSQAVSRNLRQGAHHTILLVDDESIVNEVVAEMLVQLGYSVERCSNGKDAVERYRGIKDNIDLVILDMVMPKLGGHDTFFALRDINRDIKVLLASGKAKDNQIETVLAQGAKGYLQKPFTAEELAQKVDAVLRRS